jgi:hypothetical protein
MSRKQMFKDLKSEVSPQELQELLLYRRRQGNTTAQILKLIGLAMSEPNVPVKLRDSIPGYPRQNSNRAIIKENVIPLMRQYIDQMELQDLEIDTTDLTITYDLSFIK